jgi:predicted Rossmann fold nucleotide-binding protein DprA/Smf involved in DNA uptake
MTKRESYNAIRSIVADNAELVAFIDHELELLDKKNSAPRKPTAKQMDNANFKEMILAYLTSEPKTITEIMTDVFNDELTNQRVSALVTSLKADGKVIRVVEGRKAKFYKA